MNEQRRSAALAIGALVLAATATALIVYKASAALATIGKVRGGGTVSPKAEWVATQGMEPWLQPVVGALNYFSWVAIALAFGIVLGAMVKAFVPRRWLVGTLSGSGVRSQLFAAAAGAPLMLCSCCVAPLFEGVYERTRKLGPALGLMFAAPALNPAALALTFLLFPADLAWTRFAAAAALVFLASALLGIAFDRGAADPIACAADDAALGGRSLLRGFFSALGEVARSAMPAIALGVVISVALMNWVPIPSLGTTAAGSTLATLAIAAIAVPIALPTFAEIPIGLALQQAGAPTAAVLALLIAGPAVNLPSLLTLGKVTSWRVAAATGAAVFAVSAMAGILLTG